MDRDTGRMKRFLARPDTEGLRRHARWSVWAARAGTQERTWAPANPARLKENWQREKNQIVPRVAH